MNREDIIRMAKQAAEETATLVPTEWNDPLLERFAALVTAEKDKEIERLREAVLAERVAAIRSLTDQCAALIRERDDFQKQLWRYEKNGVTCQTYRHTVEHACAECNVQMKFTNTNPEQPR